MAMNRHHLPALAGFDLLVAGVIALVAGASIAAAQSLSDVGSPPASGWVLTPTMVFSTSHDDNVLAREVNDSPQGDVVNVLNPRAALDFTGRRTQFSGTYDGAALLYRNFDTLNSYDQHGGVRGSYRLSPHVSMFAASTVALAPTTDSLQLAGVPFIRTGSSLKDLSGGVNAAFTKRTSMVAEAGFQWVHFDDARPLDLILRGGHSQGGSLTLKHRLSARTTLTGDYSMDRALVANGQAEFHVQNSSVGFEHKLSDVFQLFAAGGVSHLGLTTFGPARTGASYRAGLTSQLRLVNVDVSYNRSFVPSFGFGGTMQNQDFTAQVRATPTRRTYVQSTLSWRRNDPLTIGELSLHTFWMQVTGGYAIQPWARIEGFYGGLSSTFDRPGGVVDRTRFGFQIVTAKPIRIR
jgi:hypothetical protein